MTDDLAQAVAHLRAELAQQKTELAEEKAKRTRYGYRIDQLEKALAKANRDADYMQREFTKLVDSEALYLRNRLQTVFMELAHLRPYNNEVNGFMEEVKAVTGEANLYALERLNPVAKSKA